MKDVDLEAILWFIAALAFIVLVFIKILHEDILH